MECWSNGYVLRPILRYSMILVAFSVRVIHDGHSNINVGPDPIVGRRGVSLTGNVLGEKYVTGEECLTRAVTKPDIDASG